MLDYVAAKEEVICHNSKLCRRHRRGTDVLTSLELCSHDGGAWVPVPGQCSDGEHHRRCEPVAEDEQQPGPQPHCHRIWREGLFFSKSYGVPGRARSDPENFPNQLGTAHEARRF